LYKYVQEFYPEYNISRRMVWNFLSKQETHQRFSPVKRTKDIQHTVLEEPKKQIGIDLVDMGNYEYKGFKYILTCIDMFSKKAYAEALPNKEAATVTKAMEKIINDQLFYTSSIRSDRGSEFIDKGFKEMLAKYNIKQVLSLAGKPQSNGQIERFNRTLKRALIIGMQIQGNNNWVKILPQFVQNYNNSVHSVTGKTPNEVDEEDNDSVLEDISKKISKSVVSRNENDKPRFKIGDQVRVKLPEENRKHGENWSRKTYRIFKVLQPKNKVSSVTYFIQNGKEKLKQKYYNNDLLYVPGIQNKLDDPEYHIVSKIIKPLIHQKEPSFEIKWKNKKDHTIEPRSTLIEDVPKMIRTFEREHNVEWRNGRCYYDEKTAGKNSRRKKTTNPKAKKQTPSLPSPLPPKSPQPKTTKIINSSVNQTNVPQGQRQKKKKVFVDV